MRIHTLIVSDVHLGSVLSRSKDLMHILSSLTFDQLIILGDLFDDMNLNRLNREQLKLINFVRKLSNNTRVVWVEGNHDSKLIKDFPEIIGKSHSCEKYEWDYLGQKFLAIHGHQFDQFLLNHSYVTEIACFIYRLSQRLDRTLKTKISRRLRKNVENWKSVSQQVLQGALFFAELNKASTIFCGHAHNSINGFKKGNIKYWNTGCWTDPHIASFITINENGVKLWEVN